MPLPAFAAPAVHQLPPHLAHVGIRLQSEEVEVIDDSSAAGEGDEGEEGEEAPAALAVDARDVECWNEVMRQAPEGEVLLVYAPHETLEVSVSRLACMGQCGACSDAAGRGGRGDRRRGP